MLGLAKIPRRRSLFATGWLLLAVTACSPSISIGPAATDPPEPTPTEAPTVTPVPATATPTQMATETPPAQTAVAQTIDCTVTARSLRVRGGPGTDAPILGGVTAGEVVAASGRNEPGDWAAVRIPNGTNGWVSAEFLNCPTPINTLPVAPPSP
jgi:uncharacterized protein YgiM (DUF1202 family)